MSNSTHDVVVYRLGPVQSIPEADRLDLHKIWDYNCLSQKGLYKEGDLVAYIPPDNIVPDTEEYSWLNGHRRIRAKKLRGCISYGLLMPAPEGSNEGDIVTEQMGIVHYEPIIHAEYKSGPQAPPPEGYHEKYDLDALLRYSRVFEQGEKVWITEKVHGSNFRATFQNDILSVGSHHQWKLDYPEDMFWKALRNTPGLQDWLEEHPGLTVYGEIISCQKAGKYQFTYGNEWGNHTVMLFDIMSESGEYFAHELARGITQDFAWVPTIDCVPFDLKLIEELATGPSLVPGAQHPREGVVVTPVEERRHRSIGRVKLKLVSHAFLELK